MTEDILQELMLENKELKAKLDEITQHGCALGICHKSYTEGSYGILTEAPFRIRGWLITEGTWNGDFYPAEVLKTIPSNEPVPILIQHGLTEKWKDKPVGRVTKWEWNDILKGVVFEGLIEEPEVIEAIKKGEFPAVSLFSQVERQFIDGKRTITAIKPIEVSLTATPAVRSAVITFSKLYMPSIGEVSGMEEEMYDELEVPEGSVLIIDVEPEEEALAKKRKVVRKVKGKVRIPKYAVYPYYYGYPYGYPYGYGYPGYGYPGYYPYPYPYPYPPQAGASSELSANQSEQNAPQAEVKQETPKEEAPVEAPKQEATPKQEPVQEVKPTVEEVKPIIDPKLVEQIETLAKKIEAIEKRLPQEKPTPNIEELMKQYTPGHWIVARARRE